MQTEIDTWLVSNTNSIESILQSAEADEVLEFEDVFHLETNVTFNQEAIKEYNQKQMAANAAVEINNRVVEINQLINEPFKTLDYLNKFSGTDEQIELAYKNLSTGVLSALQKMYGNDEAAVNSFLQSHGAELKNGVIDFGAKSINIFSLINMAKEIKTTINSSLEKVLDGKTLEDINQELQNSYKHAYGTKNSIDLANKFRESQEAGVGYAKMLTGGAGIALVLLSGGSLIPVAAGIGVSTFGSSAISYIEAKTKTETGSLSPEDKAAIIKELKESVLLTAAGMGIGKTSAALGKELLKRCPKFIAFVGEYGSDAAMSLITDMAITGNVDLSGEGIAQLINIATGIRAGKTSGSRTNTASSKTITEERAQETLQVKFNEDTDLAESRPQTEDVDFIEYMDTVNKAAETAEYYNCDKLFNEVILPSSLIDTIPASELMERAKIFNNILINSKLSTFTLNDMLNSIPQEYILKNLRLIEKNMDKSSDDVLQIFLKENYCKDNSGNINKNKEKLLDYLYKTMKEIHSNDSGALCYMMKNIPDITDFKDYMFSYQNNKKDAFELAARMCKNDITFTKDKAYFFISVENILNNNHINLRQSDMEKLDIIYSNKSLRNNTTDANAFEYINNNYSKESLEYIAEQLKNINPNLKCKNITTLAQLYDRDKNKISEIIQFLSKNNFKSPEIILDGDTLKVIEADTSRGASMVLLKKENQNVIVKAFDINKQFALLYTKKQDRERLYNHIGGKVMLKEDTYIEETNLRDNTRAQISLFHSGFNLNYTLKSQRIEHFNPDGTIAFTEVWEPSQTKKGAYEIYQEYPNGQKILISTAEQNSKGDIIIEKVLESSSGTKTSYVCIQSAKDIGSFHDSMRVYQIKDRGGNVLLNRKQKIKYKDENNYTTQTDNRVFNVKYENETFHITDKDGKEFNINLSDIIDGGSSAKEFYLPILKQIPAEDLIYLKKAGIKLKWSRKEIQNAHAQLDKNGETSIIMGIGIKPEDRLFTFLHELNHTKDYRLNQTNSIVDIASYLHSDTTFQKIYKEELEALKANTNSSNEYLLNYFINNNGGKSEPLNETIAEAGAINNTDIASAISYRAQSLQQHFPRTLAYISQKISELQFDFIYNEQ